MYILLIAGSIMVPGVLFIFRWFAPRLALFFDVMAIAALYGFGWIATGAIYKILRDDMVMMTEIHRVFYNSLFLACGAYLGMYALYVVLWKLFSGWREHT
ncbi:hypothetical protein [Paenibacillus puerhi]|uniref:hypothetical protein n=1 Tax=Paenibacillus puerhi TaxID=2692622 RepID=UPI00135918F3|nr:hypothetical protein [Paenibacillus puerhi]